MSYPVPVSGVQHLPVCHIRCHVEVHSTCLLRSYVRPAMRYIDAPPTCVTPSQWFASIWFEIVLARICSHCRRFHLPFVKWEKMSFPPPLLIQTPSVQIPCVVRCPSPLWYDAVGKCQRPIVKQLCIGDNIRNYTSYVTTNLTNWSQCTWPLDTAIERQQKRW